MNTLDILYTPLDLPLCPDIDLDKFLSWMDKVYPQNQKSDAAKNKTTSENVYNDDYPWDLTFGAYNGEWADGFETQFSELANYCLSAFNITKEELRSIIFLPVREKVQGVAFWHRDLDINGFRFYLVNDRYTENPLLLRKTTEPYTSLPDLKTPLDDYDPRLQTEIYTCKLAGPTQPYYVNNFRAVHSPCINVPAKRIAVFIAIKPEHAENVRCRSEELLLRSVNKYKDMAILY